MPGTSTLLLDTAEWDLVLDVNGNIAVASDPYSLAQDAASAIQTYRGECYWDTSLGVPYLSDVLGRSPALALMKSLFVSAAKTVLGIASARAFLVSLTDRRVSGQVQVTSTSGETAAVNFAVINPQGGP